MLRKPVSTSHSITQGCRGSPLGHDIAAHLSGLEQKVMHGSRMKKWQTKPLQLPDFFFQLTLARSLATTCVPQLGKQDSTSLLSSFDPNIQEHIYKFLFPIFPHLSDLPTILSANFRIVFSAGFQFLLSGLQTYSQRLRIMCLYIYPHKKSFFYVMKKSIFRWRFHLIICNPFKKLQKKALVTKIVFTTTTMKIIVKVQRLGFVVRFIALTVILYLDECARSLILSLLGLWFWSWIIFLRRLDRMLSGVDPQTTHFLRDLAPSVKRPTRSPDLSTSLETRQETTWL